MKKEIAILTFLFFFAIGTESQIALTPYKHHSIYAELGGNSLKYSLNYDYTLSLAPNTKLAIGIGSGYIFYQSSGGCLIDTYKFFVITPQANFLISAYKNHYFETGLSLSKVYEDYDNYFATGLRIGYRYQPLNGGFMFRLGLTPLYYKDSFHIFGGVSAGYTF